MLAAALADAVGVLAGEWVVLGRVGGQSLPALDVALWLGSWTFAVEPVVVVTMYWLYPHGTRARGVAGWAAGAAVAACLLGLAQSMVAPLQPDPAGPFAGLHNPVGVSGVPGLDALLGVGLLLGNGVLVVRWLRSSENERRAFRILAVVALIGFVLPLLPVSTATARLLYQVHTLVLLLVVLTAVLRHQLYGIELVLNRTLVYVTLSALIAGVYAGLVALAGLAGWGTSGVGDVPAAVVAALCLVPARDRVQRVVNRLMYGERDEPFAVVSRIASYLETSADPEQLLERLLGSIVSALRLPAAQVTLEAGDGTSRLIAVGADGAGADDRFPLVYQGVALGELAVTRRPGQTALATDETRLLAHIASQAAAVAQELVLREQLLRSRERVIGVAEEERRRLRQDLHDGLGPLLTAAASRVDACHGFLGRDNVRVAVLLDDIRGDLTEGIGDLRRLVNSLRPVVLDELGLAEAVRQRCDRSAVPATLLIVGDLPGAARCGRDHGVPDHRRSPHQRGAPLPRPSLHGHAPRPRRARDRGRRRRYRRCPLAARRRADLHARASHRARRALHRRTRARGRSRLRHPAPRPGRGARMSDTGPVRVVIVDDHPVVVDGLRASLESSPGFQVLGEAGSGEEALRRVDELHPDVVLMDLEMPGMGGLEAIRRLTRRHPEVAVLVLTMFDQDELVLSALRAGARGYILKGAPRDDVVRSITAVARGDAVFGGDVADRLLGMVASGTTLPTAFPELSEREREVLALLANGMSNGAIARRLGLSPRTVANHVSNILPKIHATDRAHAVIAARQAGLGGLHANGRAP